MWAFTKRAAPRYCSVTVPLYLGLGASGGSYLRDVFYLNTFSVAEYVKALEDGRMGVALSIDLTEGMQRAGWLYWRIYETRFRKADYLDRFGEDLDGAYGRYLRPMSRLGLLQDDGEHIALSDRGAFWLHAWRGPAVHRLRQQALGCVTARPLAGASHPGVNLAHVAVGGGSERTRYPASPLREPCRRPARPPKDDAFEGDKGERRNSGKRPLRRVAPATWM